MAVLERTPEWSVVPSDTPAVILKLLRRCLEKEARRRLRDIGDARYDLEEACNQPERDLVSERPRPRARRVEFQRLTDIEGLKETPAISPDGKTVAYIAVVAGKRQVWIRLLAGGGPLQLTRDDAHHIHPRWAPDSSTLIYFTPAPAGADAGTIWEIGAPETGRGRIVWRCCRLAPTVHRAGPRMIDRLPFSGWITPLSTATSR